MPKIALLTSNILSPGTKFVVTDNSIDNTIGPGTTGFISHVIGHDQDYANVAYMRTVIIKRGKLGKERLDVGEMSVPIFDIKSDAMAKIMPDEKRRYYVHIEPLKLDHMSIDKMSDIDFLAWAQSTAAYVRKLHSKAKQMTAWPVDTGDILNRMYCIADYYGEDSEATKKEYGNQAVRDNFVQSFRIMESTLIRCALLYKVKIIEIERRAAQEIYSQGVVKDQEEALSETFNHLDRERTKILSIEMERSKKQQS